MEAGRSQLEAKPEETEIYHFFWSCLLYIFSVEEDGSNVRSKRFFWYKTCSCAVSAIFLTLHFSPSVLWLIVVFQWSSWGKKGGFLVEFVEERGSSYLLTILRSVIFAIHQNSFCSESKNHSIQLNDGKTALLKILKTCFKSYSRMCEVQGKPHSVRVFRSDS